MLFVHLQLQESHFQVLPTAPVLVPTGGFQWTLSSEKFSIHASVVEWTLASSELLLREKLMSTGGWSGRMDERNWKISGYRLRKPRVWFDVCHDAQSLILMIHFLKYLGFDINRVNHIGISMVFLPRQICGWSGFLSQWLFDKTWSTLLLRASLNMCMLSSQVHKFNINLLTRVL